MTRTAPRSANSETRGVRTVVAGMERYFDWTRTLGFLQTVPSGDSPPLPVDWLRLVTPALYLLFFILLLGVGLSAYLRWFHLRYSRQDKRAKPTPTEDIWRQHVPPDLGDLDPNEPPSEHER